jgi:hypothetical protein
MTYYPQHITMIHMPMLESIELVPPLLNKYLIAGEVIMLVCATFPSLPCVIVHMHVCE